MRSFPARFSQILFSCFLFLLAGKSYAQTATIRGTVSSQSTGESVLFGVVHLEGTGFGVQTDINGFYSLTKIPAGTYTMVAQHSSFDSVHVTITIKAGEIATKNIVMKPRTLKAVVISAKSQETQENPGVSKTTMDRKDIM
ncbi:MAG TPA: carboxypeptidase-like regulatory domain-containing protein, partial [Bacteroidia bacterium]|nr:carboxypeptidase-like regulatory domain-containing protein [Bacteroidia bacterium]